MTGWENKLTEQTPLWEGDFLKELKWLQGFRKWSLIGIGVLGDVWKGGKMLTFDTLREEFQMGGGEFLRYRQLRLAFHCYLEEGTVIPEYSPLEDRLLLDPMIDKAVSLTYKKLVNNSPDCMGSLREAWESDVGLEEDDDWAEALQRHSHYSVL